MRFLKVVPALKVKMSVWGVQVGPYGFSAVLVSLVLSGHGQASRSSGSLLLMHTHDTAWTGSMAGSPQATLIWPKLDTWHKRQTIRNYNYMKPRESREPTPKNIAITNLDTMDTASDNTAISLWTRDRKSTRLNSSH